MLRVAFTAHPSSPAHAQVLEARLTTGQVVSQIVVPATTAKRCRFTDLLAEAWRKPGGAVSSGRAFFFVSHAWARPFAELVEQLRHYFRSADISDVFVW
jgi:hypothetical protein